MVRAENQYGTMAPKSTDANTMGLSRFTPCVLSAVSGDMRTDVRVMKAPNSASDTSAAEPIAKPCPEVTEEGGGT